MAGAYKKGQPFSPSVAPQIHKAPWPVPLQYREWDAKLLRYIVSHNAPNEGAHHVSLHPWLLYIVRFIFTGDIFNARGNFGGLPAQFCLISIATHLAVVETAAFSISYDADLRGIAQRLARSRDTPVYFAKTLSGDTDDVKRYLEGDLWNVGPRAMAYGASRKQFPNGGKNANVKGKGAKATNPNWVRTPFVPKFKGKRNGSKFRS